MTKVIFLSWAYPPMRVPRATQVERIAQNLEQPIEMVCGGETADGATSRQTSGCDPQIRLTRLIRPRWRRYVDGVLAHTIPGSLTTPDPYWDWARRAARYVVHNIGISTQDVLITFGQPMSDHLAGLRIKRVCGMPWIAHFSDPWSDNPLLRRGAVSMRLNRWMERRVIESADSIIMTSEETVDLVMGKYAADIRRKVHVIPHAYDPVAYPACRRPRPDGRLVIRHLGNFYGQRTPQPLLDGLKVLAARAPDSLTNICVELIGSFEKGLESHLDQTGLPPALVKVLPAVGYEASLRMMVEADALLVIDAPADISVFLPSKLIEYIGSGRPILGITPPGAAAQLIASLGGPVANPLDPDTIAESLSNLIDQARRVQPGCPWGAADVRRRFTAGAVATQFNEAIEAVRGHR